MPSVTQIIKKTKQPRGGYIKPTDFKIIEIDDDELNVEENIHAILIVLQ